jgi:hypothetical protein
MLKDKELQMALVYFLLRDDLRVREYSLEMLFSRGYDTDMSLDSGNWSAVSVFEINLN